MARFIKGINFEHMLYLNIFKVILIHCGAQQIQYHTTEPQAFIKWETYPLTAAKSDNDFGRGEA